MKDRYHTSTSYISKFLRQLVYDRAKGCCEYCLTPEIIAFVFHQIDHVISEKHGGATTEDNLALSCILCNQHKGSDIASVDPLTKEIVPLFNPRQDHWSHHFQLPETEFTPVTAVGRVTVRLLQLNRPDRIEERKLLLAANLLVVPT